QGERGKPGLPGEKGEAGDPVSVKHLTLGWGAEKPEAGGELGSMEASVGRPAPGHHGHAACPSEHAAPRAVRAEDARTAVPPSTIRPDLHSSPALSGAGGGRPEAVSPQTSPLLLGARDLPLPSSSSGGCLGPSPPLPRSDPEETPRSGRWNLHIRAALWDSGQWSAHPLSGWPGLSRVGGTGDRAGASSAPTGV
ncbi:unnamed protein product, partial [Gulo gulo]